MKPSPTNEHVPALRVDAHHHLWHYTVEEFGWIDDSMAALRRNFLPNNLQQEIDAAGVHATVAVQARESLEETRWLLECSKSSPAIRGVVGWAPLASPDLPRILDEFAEADRLVGFREIVQGKPDGYLDGATFNRGIKELTRRGLTYDILIYRHQLPEAARFIDRHPHQRFVLDHAAKPDIRNNELEPWRSHLRELALRPNVFCKISGLVTEADWNNWSLVSLRPYLETCVEAFGPHRLMAGSDWPVCLVASTYTKWWDVLKTYFQSFSDDESSQIFGQTAVDFYSLARTTSDR